VTYNGSATYVGLAILSADSIFVVFRSHHSQWLLNGALKSCYTDALVSFSERGWQNSTSPFAPTFALTNRPLLRRFSVFIFVIEICPTSI